MCSPNGLYPMFLYDFFGKTFAFRIYEFKKISINLIYIIL